MADKKKKKKKRGKEMGMSIFHQCHFIFPLIRRDQRARALLLDTPLMDGQTDRASERASEGKRSPLTR